ncbi:hypothetical protein KFE98_03370 [bacterium SCSIO 12741]|nr:hypothetical protein KFE98_03370 [bacterium SCSIO 12741]
MKTLLTFAIALAAFNFSYAQNTFPSSGNVGIGTTSPQADLDIRGGGIILGGTQKHIIHTQNWVPNADALIFAHKISGSWDWNNSLSFKTDGMLQKNASSDNLKAIVVRNTATPGNHFETFRVMGNGKVFATEVEVLLANQFPDYVFEDKYELMTLSDLRTYIDENQHLPNVPSAEEVGEGMEVGEMVRLQMEKIEELTLYILQLQEQIDELKKNQK